MSPDKQAMIVEQEELIVKTAALERLVRTSPTFKELNVMERSRMIMQLAHMEKYLYALTLRIKAAT